MNQRQSIFLPLQRDELLSSWLVRMALAYGCSPLVLTGELWPKWRLWTVDSDRELPEERLRVVSQFSGLPVSDFQTAALRPTLEAVSSPLSAKTMWPWLLALGTRNRTRRGGLQCCPHCLAEDQQPYYRRSWRLAWHTACPIHYVQLIDRCPHCAAPLEPHRVNVYAEGKITQCSRCKADYRDALTIPATSSALAFQQAADQVIAEGFGTFGEQPISSQVWFALTRYFLGYLRQVSLRPESALATTLTTLGVRVDAVIPPATGLSLELLPTYERLALLTQAWPILQAGPAAFLQAAQEVGLQGSALYDPRFVPPAPIEELAAQLPSQRRKRSKTEKSWPKPRSKQAVMRMYARLQRKL